MLQSARRVLMLAAAVMLAASSAYANEKLALKVWSLPDPDSTLVPHLADLEVAREFERRHPHIQLTRFAGLEIKERSMDSRALMAIAGGMPPDVLYVNFRQSDTYISQGFLHPLDEYLKDIPEKELTERVPAPATPVIFREGADGKKHWWAMPYAVFIRAIMYRKDLFAEVGLDPEHPPETWEELERYAKRLTRPDKGMYGLQTGKLQNYIWSAGGDIVVQDEKGDWRAVFDSPEAVEACLLLAHLNYRPWRDASGEQRRGYVYRGAEGSWEKWLNGQIGISEVYLDDATIAGHIGDPDVIGIAPFAKGPTGLRGSELNCGMMGIFADPKPRGAYSAEDVRKAAFDYIWFYGGEEAKRIRTQVFVSRGFGRFVNPIYLKQFGYDEYLEMVPKSWVETYEEAMKYGKPEPYGKNCQLIYQFVAQPFNEILDLEARGKLGATDDERRARIRGILEAGVRRTNQEMIGLISPEERRKRNNVALVAAICIFTVFLLVLGKVWRTFTPKGAGVEQGWRFRRYRWAYIIMLPALLSILLWKYYPLLSGSIMTFQDWRVVGESEFVGLRNLADVLWDPVWWASLWRTLYYMLLMLGLGFWTPIVLAILLAEVSHGKILYRTLYYLPAVLTGMVVIYLWKLFFDPGDTGLLNMLLATVGLPKLGWITDAQLAMLCCVIPTVWAGMGPGCLVYLAALKSVPDDLYEAADIDGCGFLGKVRHITLPTLKGLIIIQFIGAFISASQSAGFILVMTFGGPMESTKVAGLHIFEKAYLQLRFGTAVTMAWMLAVVTLGFTTIQLRRLSKMEFTTAEQRKTRNS